VQVRVAFAAPVVDEAGVVTPTIVPDTRLTAMNRRTCGIGEFPEAGVALLFHNFYLSNMS
jgi:hypothetical protein